MSHLGNCLSNDYHQDTTILSYREALNKGVKMIQKERGDGSEYEKALAVSFFARSLSFLFPLVSEKNIENDLTYLLTHKGSNE